MFFLFFEVVQRDEGGRRRMEMEPADGSSTPLMGNASFFLLFVVTTALYQG